MNYAQLGRTGLEVSRLCLGTMNFGPETAEKDAFALMDRALEQGINFIDSANVYGSEKGLTEDILGRWFAQGGNRRDQVVLTTKVYGPMWEGPNGGRLSAYHIRRACEDSLRRLQTDHIDLYQMHHVDRSTPWEEIWQAMENLVRDGKVLYVGSSNFGALHVALAQMAARERHFLGLVSEQSLYNLTMRMIELEMVPTCQEFGLGILPWSPLGGGLLGGALKPDKASRRQNDYIQGRVEKQRSQIEQYEKLCGDLGEQPAAVALAWLLHQPAVTAPIIGPRTVEQLDDVQRAVELKLDEGTLQTLDEIWPGPGGHAPEAYAW